MTSHAYEPLTPEERELAARLARIGPHGEPSPALDARILGAAQAAAVRKPADRRRPRWPAWAGIAATLALALGAVWQLRPVQEVPVALEETAPTLSRQSSPSAAAERSEAITPETAPAPAEPLTAPESRSMQAPKPAPQPASPPSPSQVKATPVPAPVVFDEPSPRGMAAPAPPPAPPAPPAPRSAKQAPPVAAAARPREAQAASATFPMLAESTAREAQSDDNGFGATVTVSDLPVASDRQLPPEDWIERIRQRRDAGELASARASLAWLQLDHPQMALPADVRAIAAAPHPDR